MKDVADIWVLGVVDSLSDPRTEVVAESEVVCEVREGVPDPDPPVEGCTTSLRVMVVDLVIRVEEVISGPAARSDLIAIPLSVDTVSGPENTDFGTQAIAALRETVPIGRQVVAALILDGQRVGAAGLGLIDEQDAIHPIVGGEGSSGVGLAEVQAVDQLRAALVG